MHLCFRGVTLVCIFHEKLQTMRLLFFVAVLALLSFSAQSQLTYTSYFTGNESDVVTSPTGGICLMGGSAENDEAMKWFLNRADGGDILVIRASGSDGYNDYLFSELGVTVNSVESIVFHGASASDEEEIQSSIMNAEAIWVAGGDQWDYVSYWRDSPVQDLINTAITERNIVIGGTSAGMAIMGSHYFSAQNGTVTSSEALQNPYRTDVTVSSLPFIENAHLQDVITDTHYDDPDRKGRHVTFLARIFQDEGVYAKGLACEERTAVCIDENGIANVYGNDPVNDIAYFIQANCALEDGAPENCTANETLTWNHGGEALKVYKILAQPDGNNSFDLNDWQTGEGGVWEQWSADDGELNISASEPLDCPVFIGETEETKQIAFYPNPTQGIIYISGVQSGENRSVVIRDVAGKTVYQTANFDTEAVDLQFLKAGSYFISLTHSSGTEVKILVIE